MLLFNLRGGCVLMCIQIQIVTDIYHIYWTAKVEGEFAPAPKHHSMKVYGRVEVKSVCVRNFDGSEWSFANLDHFSPCNPVDMRLHWLVGPGHGGNKKYSPCHELHPCLHSQSVTELSSDVLSILCFHKNVIYMVMNKNIYIILICVMQHIHPNASSWCRFWLNKGRMKINPKCSAEGMTWTGFEPNALDCLAGQTHCKD